MKQVAIFVSLTLAIVLVAGDDARIDEEFAKFKIDYNRSYVNVDEETARKRIFADNFHYISAHNEKYDRGEVSYKLDMNQFMDRLPKEISRGLIADEAENQNDEYAHMDDNDIFKLKGMKDCQHKWCLAFSGFVQNVAQEIRIKENFKAFQEKFSKSYNGIQEETKRRTVYVKNLALVANHNERFEKGEVSYTLDVNKFADLEPHELLRGLMIDIETNSTEMSDAPPPFNLRLDTSAVSLPATVDWRTVLTPVKNQGACGSCWAFSVTGAIEGRYRIKTASSVSLSEQQLMDCSRLLGNMGCQGGYINRGFFYAMLSGGLNSASAYPYLAQDGQSCKSDRRSVAASISGYMNVDLDEQALQLAVSEGPVAVGINSKSITLYKSGVYDDASCTQNGIDHAVLVVGYGTEGGKDYWLVKNSWGTGWGDQGYIKMARNKNNQCGIASMASYPIVRG